MLTIVIETCRIERDGKPIVSQPVSADVAYVIVDKRGDEPVEAVLLPKAA